MKKIEAIIRKTKFDDVKEALSKVGIDFFSFWEVRGIGRSREERAFRGIIYDTSAIERIKISIVVRDKNLKNTINAILESGKTGAIGDGKIFVVDIEESYRIRTGEKGDEALFIKGEEE
ncbi:P-II family nitrogen regulator [Marinilabilia sp.]|uniref:P-II family nitrogen regulator n=1 Tax=Marinilabilia sp. TaxID=2021252 RepID=UPI0025C15E2F|nr:P-II family nitrogen regulator [Marinilabilia sp.]